MADIITLNELRSAIGLDPTDTRKDAMYSTLIPWVTEAIKSYTERDFGAEAVTESRLFEYDGSGYLDIDDASEITEVRFLVQNGTDIVLDDNAWYPAPTRRDDSPVYYYIVINGVGGVSPEMGFTQNLDVLYSEGRYPSISRTAQVTGTWGWPEVPGDVKLAAVWTIQEWASKPSSEGLTAESIEGYSRAWGTRTEPSPALAIPNRARDLLARYIKNQI